MKKAVVIGGSGFIGSHVADALSNAQYDVTVYDHVESKWISSNQKMIKGSILDTEKLDQVIAEASVVYNFAALADLNQAIDQPEKTVEINILGNVKVLKACHKHKVKRFVYASSIYVYSREGGFYRCSKQASESYIEEFYNVYGLEYTILRYGSLYGPRADHTNGIWRIVKSAIENRRVVHEGNEDAMREYMHVQDAAIASVKILDFNFINESIVMTGQEAMHVYDMLKMLSEIMGFDENSLDFKGEDYQSHYVRTPYSYIPKIGKKYIPPVHVDLGQGLLQVIEEIEQSI
jgi:UDP-glucose 4-epimerase